MANNTTKRLEPSVRERNAEAKKLAILDAALTLFSERGFHGVAVPEVASKAGVGAGTIYRYFENKEDLVNHVFRYAKNKLASALLEKFPFEASYREQFHAFWIRLTGFSHEHPITFRFLELQDHAPYLDTESKAAEGRVLLPILQFCSRAKSEGIARDMPEDTLMAIIWGAFVGIKKAEDSGYIRSSEETLAATEEACWDMFSRASPERTDA